MIGAVKVSERYGRGTGAKIIDRIDDRTHEFSRLYDQYLNCLTARDLKSANVKIEEIKKSEVRLVNDILLMQGGYMVLEVAEKHGTKVNWQAVPVNLIDNEHIINFLTQKGFDFNKDNDYGNNIVMSFVDYHVALMADDEHKIVKYYNTLIDIIKKRDKLIEGFQKDKAEFKAPNTSAERKKELMTKMKSDNEVFLKIEKVIPSLYEQVNKTMGEYFIHADSLDQVLDKKLFSEESIKKVDPATFEGSISNMLGRSKKMEEIKAFFIKEEPKNQPKQ